MAAPPPFVPLADDTTPSPPPRAIPSEAGNPPLRSMCRGFLALLGMTRSAGPRYTEPSCRVSMSASHDIAEADHHRLHLELFQRQHVHRNVQEGRMHGHPSDDRVETERAVESRVHR